MAVGTTQNNYGKYVVGVFHSYPEAEDAIHDLTMAGIPANRIGLATSDNGSVAQPGSEGESFWRKIANFFEGKDHSTEVDEATTMNPNLAGYGSKLQDGGVLVSVSTRAPEEEQECRNIFEAHGAHMQEGTAGAPVGVASGVDSDVSSAGQRIQLLSEVLRVQKERVATGEVRLRKEVVTENQSIEVPVTREELVIERRPVQGGTTASREIGADQEIRVPLSEEQVRVEKRPIVREEVTVGKKRVQESRQVNEQVKREELHVEGQGDVNSDLDRRSARKKDIA